MIANLSHVVEYLFLRFIMKNRVAMPINLRVAILMVSDSLTLLKRTRVFEYAAKRRLPAIYETDSL